MQGRVQFFIDALDSNVWSDEIEILINRFPINLELEFGVAFTERIMYTDIYNIPGLGFDMSFRVQCSENCYSSNCTTFCEPIEDLYTCNSEGRIACIHNGQNSATNCTRCLFEWTRKQTALLAYLHSMIPTPTALKVLSVEIWALTVLNV